MQLSSLSDVLNDLAGGRVASLAQNLDAPQSKITELDIFLEQDEILASLERDYRYARRQHKLARKEHGIDSPMADIAADMEDSAWCAMQTRLMELREQGDLMRFVQKRLWDAQLEEERSWQAETDKKALDFFNKIEFARIMKERNKTSHIYEWLIILMLINRSMHLPFPQPFIPQRIAA